MLGFRVSSQQLLSIPVYIPGSRFTSRFSMSAGVSTEFPTDIKYDQNSRKTKSSKKHLCFDKNWQLYYTWAYSVAEIRKISNRPQFALNDDSSYRHKTNSQQEQGKGKRILFGTNDVGFEYRYTHCTHLHKIKLQKLKQN